VQAITVSSVLLQIGIWVRNFAILLYVMDKTGNDPTAVSLISVAEFAPIFLFSFIGGTFADRWRPKRTMIWSDLLSAVSVFVVLATLIAGVWEAIFFATLVSAILSQFSQPSGMKLFKQHVPPEQVQTGMALIQSLFGIFMIIGPIIGTFVYQQFGIYTSIGVMGIAFLLSAATLTFLPADIREETEQKKTTLKQEMVEGIKYVWSKPVLKTLGAGFMAAGLAIGLIQPLGVFVVTERLGQPKEFLQWFLVANGIAMLIGGGLTMALAKKIAPQKMLAFGMIMSAVTMSVIGFSTSVPLTLTMQFLNGLVFPTINISISTIMLQSSDEAYIGRVNGILNPTFMGMMVIMMSVAGPLKHMFEIVPLYEAAALLFVIGALFCVSLFKHKLTPPSTPPGGEGQPEPSTP
jgi:MFS transporter, DHA3 family, macrolide efflux protein